MSNDATQLSRIVRARAVIEARTESFVELIKLSGLDPNEQLRFSNWSDISFKNCDLRGFDFTGSYLRNCDFHDALIDRARFDQADIQGTNLRKARDWTAHAENWRRAKTPVASSHLRSGAVFQDAPFAPEMVAIPAGQFDMGSREGEGHPTEYPNRSVSIGQRIAVGRYPVTFDEWDTAERLSGVSRKPPDEGWGRGRRPVINVSWRDAIEYVSWLVQVTGKPYRLLSEAEWEYCCRAGTTTSYNTGNAIAKTLAHFSEGPEWGGAKRTVEVGKFPANAFGLHDMHGNVWEWCEDVAHDSYKDAPSDGSAWVHGADESIRVVRGGSWNFFSNYTRSAFRGRDAVDDRNNVNGFRVARAL